MKDFALSENGDLKVTAFESSSRHDFDFYVGKWPIRNRKLKTRLQNSDDWIEFEAKQEMRLILNGLGNVDNFLTEFDGEPFEGMSLRIFNPETKLWSMYWADNSGSLNIDGALDPPVVGSFENDIGAFYAKDTFDGKDIIVKFQWDKTNPDEPIWSQAFSVDEGKTWEWNWYMYSKRIT